MLMPERKYLSSSLSYRFGFQNQEIDIDLFDGAIIFDFRAEDPRLGRFFSVDPIAKSFPWNSPYAFSENSPIRFIELEGKERAEPKMFELAKRMINDWRSEIVSTGNDKTLVSNLSRTEVLNQLEKMMNLVHDQKTISSCNQVGWYCGPLAALGAAAINNPMGYATMVWDLVTTGKSDREGSLKNGLVLPIWISDIDMSIGTITQSNYHGTGLTTNFAIDLIVMYSLRASENDRSASGQNLISNYTQKNAGTLPWEIDDMFNRLGMSVENQRIYRGQGNGILKKLEEAVESNYTPIIFDNEIITQSGIDPNSPQGSKERVEVGKGIELNVGIHYIVLLKFKRNKAERTVDYTTLENGTIKEHKGVSYRAFRRGMKGFWIPKNN
ncbi:hypothetical protein [Paraflavitalea sp. sgz302552]